MNPRIKRLLSMLLALTLVFSLVTPATASAASAAAVASNKVEIEVGESKKLSSSGWLSKTTWTSSDETVATVSSNGTVTGVAAGTATITATSKSLLFFFGGSTKTTTYTVVVIEGVPEETTPEETQPEETQPGEDGLTVKAGETLQLEVNANGGTVTWKSSNKNIATVDNNGLVTGVSEGTVIITATVKKTTGGNGFWFFWWGSKTTTTTTEFEVTVLPGDEQPTEPPVTEPPVTEPPVTEPPVVTYTVTFESNGGSAVVAQVVEEGMTATEPEAPTMEGYAFAGWYADAELAEAYDFAATVHEDLTLYADWTIIPTRPERPENLPEEEAYFWDNAEVIEVIEADKSEVVPTEEEAINILIDRGFDDFPVTYDFDIDGSYVDNTEAQSESSEKHPVYYTYYRTQNDEIWIIYVINDSVMAYPLSYNMESILPAELIFSESETITSYVDESNKYYVTIPSESMMIVRVVEQINADALEQLTIAAIDALV